MTVGPYTDELRRRAHMYAGARRFQLQLDSFLPTLGAAGLDALNSILVIRQWMQIIAYASAVCSHRAIMLTATFVIRYLQLAGWLAVGRMHKKAALSQ